MTFWKIFLLFFPRKQDLTFHAKYLLLKRQSAWNLKSYFLGKILKIKYKVQGLPFVNIFRVKVVELFNFTTCPKSRKWSKSTCPSKIYLSTISSHNVFSSKNKKNIYLTIWILFLARPMNLWSLCPRTLNFLLVLREMGQVGHEVV